MGRNFLAYLPILLALYPAPEESLAAEENPAPILLPEKPPVMKPPYEAQDEMLQDLRRKQKLTEPTATEKEDHQQQEEQKKEQLVDRTKNRELVEESLKTPSPRFNLSATLAAPRITTTGNKRKNYTAEPTVIVHWAVAPNEPKKESKFEFWTGLRYAPFCGAASYKSTAGRYCYSYFGPMVGMGRLSEVPKSSDEKAQQSVESAQEFHRHGLFWLSGIAAVNRMSHLPEGVKSPGDDLSTSKSIAFDLPGIWSEISYVSMDYNAISSNYLLGVQVGNGKVYVYAGIGLALWR
jgi:hypothetical protein